MNEIFVFVRHHEEDDFPRPSAHYYASEEIAHEAILEDLRGELIDAIEDGVDKYQILPTIGSLTMNNYPLEEIFEGVTGIDHPWVEAVSYTIFKIRPSQGATQGP